MSDPLRSSPMRCNCHCNNIRQLSLCGFVGIVAVMFSWGAAFGQPKDEEEEARLKRDQVLARNTLYAPPERISRRSADPTKKEVTVDLNVEFAEVQVDYPMPDGKIAQHKLRVRTYNGKMTTPEIRVEPGDLLRVRLFNRINRNEPDKPYAANKPNGFNITNLHTHGLHVSPEGRSDNVYLEVGPEEGIGLC
ncbi:MAG: hypothetical protein L0211_06995, partial [Planctomycetaceae bacterium]|nr:hypothetical protein [Planctomycetaceae bacterium]